MRGLLEGAPTSFTVVPVSGSVTTNTKSEVVGLQRERS